YGHSTGHGQLMAWPPVRTRRYTRGKESPGLSNRGSKSVMSGGKRSRTPETPRYYPKAQIRQGWKPNATFRVGADGETGDFKGLTLPNSSPVLLGIRGFSLNRSRGEGLPAAATVAYLSRHHACPSAYSSDRLHCAVPPHQSPHAAVRRPMAARDQA